MTENRKEIELSQEDKELKYQPTMMEQLMGQLTKEESDEEEEEHEEVKATVTNQVNKDKLE